MIVNTERKFVFFHVPKNGGTSIRRMFRKCPGDNWAYAGKAHRTVKEFETDPVARDWQGFYRWAVKRNPWDRFASGYRHTIVRAPKEHSKLTFLEFAHKLEDKSSWPHSLLKGDTVFMPQWHFTESHHGNRPELLEFDGIEDRVNGLVRGLGVKVGPMPHENRSDKVTFETKWDERAIDIVARIYARDIDELGYRFEGEMHAGQREQPAPEPGQPQAVLG